MRMPSAADLGILRPTRHPSAVRGFPLVNAALKPRGSSLRSLVVESSTRVPSSLGAAAAFLMFAKNPLRNKRQPREFGFVRHFRGFPAFSPPHRASPRPRAAPIRGAASKIGSAASRDDTRRRRAEFLAARGPGLPAQRARRSAKRHLYAQRIAIHARTRQLPPFVAGVTARRSGADLGRSPCPCAPPPAESTAASDGGLRRAGSNSRLSTGG